MIPYIGKAVVGKKEPYEYLTKSIDEFINQDELIELMKQNNFQNCIYPLTLPNILCCSAPPERYFYYCLYMPPLQRNQIQFIIIAAHLMDFVHP